MHPQKQNMIGQHLTKSGSSAQNLLKEPRISSVQERPLDTHKIMSSPGLSVPLRGQIQTMAPVKTITRFGTGVPFWATEYDWEPRNMNFDERSVVHHCVGLRVLRHAGGHIALPAPRFRFSDSPIAFTHTPTPTNQTNLWNCSTSKGSI